MGLKGGAFLPWLGYRTPLEETRKWLDIVEGLADAKRHDLSALKSQQAILAK